MTDKRMKMVQNGGMSAMYGLGFLGALVYYLMHATSFWGGALGVIKAVLWPAFLVFQLLTFLKM